MKKLLLLLFASQLLCSCNCLLSQIPPQYIFAGVGCTAPLPDYRSQVMVSGGCTGFTVTQTPLPGIMLNTTNKTSDVIIKATGTNGKSSQISFKVTMIDTITPKITPIGALIAYKMEQENELYLAARKITRQLLGETTKPLLVHVAWDSLSFPKAISFYADSLTVPIITMDLAQVK